MPYRDLVPRIADTPAGSVEYLMQGDGPPVLVIHGSPGGFDQGMYLGEFLLGHGFRVIAPSRPGYCQTPLTPSTTSVDGQARLFLALLDDLGIDQCAVLGWSGGGPVSYRLATLAPERVTAMTAVAAVSQTYEFAHSISDRALFGTRLGNTLLRWLADHRPDSLIRSTIAAEGDLSKSELQSLSDLAAEPGSVRDFVLGLAACYSLLPPRRAGFDNDAELYRALPALELETITIPVQLVHGTADTDVPLRYTQHARSAIPHAEYVEIPNGTHIGLWVHQDVQTLQQRVASHLAAG